MWGVVALYHAIARRRPVLLRRPILCGAAYGAIAYFGIFAGLASLLTGKPANLGDPAWILTCLVVFMILVGIPCALFSRTARSGARARRQVAPPTPPESRQIGIVEWNELVGN